VGHLVERHKTLPVILLEPPFLDVSSVFSLVLPVRVASGRAISDVSVHSYPNETDQQTLWVLNVINKLLAGFKSSHIIG
jgi:hypothetical protein